MNIGADQLFNLGVLIANQHGGRYGRGPMQGLAARLATFDDGGVGDARPIGREGRASVAEHDGGFERRTRWE
jgi:hypothetical protein